MTESKKNYLLGNGHFYTARISKPGGPLKKQHPYSFDIARKRLAPMVVRTVEAIEALPDSVCPMNESVIKAVLHPAYISKSYFPVDLLRAFNLKPIGNRPISIRPEKCTSKKQVEAVTAEIFIAGNRDDFKKLSEQIPGWHEDPKSKIHGDLRKLERVSPFQVNEKIGTIPTHYSKRRFEAVLHTIGEDYILDGFEAYLTQMGLSVNLDHRFQVGGLCFIPMEFSLKEAEMVARYSFIRSLRPMPEIRPPHPISRSSKRRFFPVATPTESPIDPRLRVAIFDGGLPNRREFAPYVKRFKSPGLGAPSDTGLEHGIGVTSAFLFGPLQDGAIVEKPFAPVSHYRVYDENTGADYLFYDVANRIQNIIQSNTDIEFFGLSIGPNINIQDDTVDLWTAMLDALLADGKRFAAIAVGNCGSEDASLGLNRIQPPSDCVNALAIGAATSSNGDWEKADYSASGPGRNPGIVKPDGLMFGGTDRDPFFVISPTREGYTSATAGTSFAAPLALRTAVGIRAHLGTSIDPLTLKALMVHKAENERKLGRHDVGWGKFSDKLEDYITCKEGEATIIYQGELLPTQWLRAQIPVPGRQELLKLDRNRATISATFCFACETEPQNPFNYTRAGLEITFRPDKDNFKLDSNGKKKLHPETDTFFSLGKMYADENMLRSDAHKWETTLHQTKTKHCKSLNGPVFDIHYLAREDGSSTLSARPIPYSLIVTVSIPNMPTLYDRIVQLYQELEILTPIEVEVPILE